MFPLLDVEDLIRIVETDTLGSCSREAVTAILALMTFVVERESCRTPPSLYSDVGGSVAPTTPLTRDEVVTCLKFIVTKRLEITFGAVSIEVGWDRLMAWCLDTLRSLMPRIIGRSRG